MYIEHVVPWKSTKWIAPPPHEIARIRKRAGTHEEAGISGADAEKDFGDASRNSEAYTNGNSNGVVNGAEQKEDTNGAPMNGAETH
jgi:hypothetical protein